MLRIAGSSNGRTRVFEARYQRSIRCPAAKVRGVVKATVTSLVKKHTASARSLLMKMYGSQDFVAGSAKWQAHWL